MSKKKGKAKCKVLEDDKEPSADSSRGKVGERIKYDHNQISTSDDCIVTGEEYDYKEDSTVFRVKVLSQNKKDDWISFDLEILSPHNQKGEQFNCGAMAGERYCYSGMWRLWDKGEYLPLVIADPSTAVVPEGLLIGYSVSKCIESMMVHEIDPSRVVKIVARTCCRNKADWDHVLEDYQSQYWRRWPHASKVAQQLIDDDKVVQPRMGMSKCVDEMRSDIIWEAAE